MNDRTQVDYLILADSVEVIDGKLYVTGGGWNGLAVADMSRAVRLSFALRPVHLDLGPRDPGGTLDRLDSPERQRP